MEEILASIRRIISDDGPPAGSAPAPVEDDVLDLTPSMQVDGSPDLPPPEPEQAPSIDELMASFDPVTPDKGGALEMEAAPVEPPSTYVHEAEVKEAPRNLSMPQPDVDVPRPYDIPQDAEDNPGRIMSPQTEAAAAAALAGVNALIGARIESAHRFEGGTVEALVRELLRPMLRDWVDNNLPSLVERLVEEEIRHITARATGGR